ncbi:helix-turn-helix domain-containing protein [Methylophaga sp.]|uniref:helix-turn-helix domain-containing protein n=1 Tax=Methylophaga sp. TaxID=2024840 RepID=UPI003F69D41A
MEQDNPIEASLSRLNGCRFNTDTQPERFRQEWLREVIGREYANVEVKPSMQARLFNDMQIYPMLNGLRFSPIRSNPIQLERLPSEPTSVFQDCYFAVLLLSGSYKIEQGGRETFLQPGDMTIYDATEPHKIITPEPFSKLIISVPRSQLECQLRNLDQLTATKIFSKNQTENVQALQRLCESMHYMDRATFESFTLPIIDIIKESLIESGGLKSDISSLKALSLFRVKQYIQTHLENDCLSAEDIAQGVRLSTRYINELFEHQNTSLMRFLTEKRLELSHHYLTNSLFSEMTITDIAYQCGFKNFSHFSRIFKQRYSYSPREYRVMKIK